MSALHTHSVNGMNHTCTPTQTVFFPSHSAMNIVRCISLPNTIFSMSLILIRWENNGSKFDGKTNQVEKKFITGELIVNNLITVQYKKGRTVYKGRIIDLYDAHKDSDSDDDLSLNQFKNKYESSDSEDDISLSVLSRSQKRKTDDAAITPIRQKESGKRDRRNILKPKSLELVRTSYYTSVCRSVWHFIR
jgi:hypothetical protein